jgi:hypothetical protein
MLEISWSVFWIIMLLTAVLSACLVYFVHLSDLEDNPTREHELIITKSAIMMIIWLSIATFVAVVVTALSAYWGGMAALTVSVAFLIIIGPQWIFFGLTLFEVELNKGYVLTHQRTGKLYAVVGLNIPKRLPNDNVIQIGQTGLRRLPSIFLTIQDENRHIISLERFEIKDITLKVMVSSITFFVKISIYAEPNPNEIVSFLFKGTAEMMSGLRHGITEFIGVIASEIDNAEQMEDFDHFVSRVKEELSRLRSADDPLTTPNVVVSKLDDLKRIWSLSVLGVNITEVTQDEDQRLVRQGLQQARDVRKAMQIYLKVEMPARVSVDYLGYLRMAPMTLGQAQQHQKKGGRNAQAQQNASVKMDDEFIKRMQELIDKPIQDLTDEEHLQRDGLVFAVIKAKDGVSPTTALEQAHVVTGQAKATNIGGRGGRGRSTILGI